MAELARRLGDGSEVADPYTASVLSVAKAAAGGHPAPQSRMAASALSVSHATILIPEAAIVQGSGGDPVPLGAIFSGAEFGSNRYRQFPAATKRGYWLWPA